MLSFRTKALVVMPVRGDNFRLIPLNCMVMCVMCAPVKLNFLSRKRNGISDD